jgi:hypothetical protein
MDRRWQSNRVFFRLGDEDNPPARLRRGVKSHGARVGLGERDDHRLPAFAANLSVQNDSPLAVYAQCGKSTVEMVGS